MAKSSGDANWPFLISVGLLSWFIPGGGYFLLKEKKRAWVILITISLLFIAGLYVGSIGVVDKVSIADKPWIISELTWYTAQVIVSPAVMVIGSITESGRYQVYGKPEEIGQIYTGIAGLLNFLCIINAVYLAYVGVGRSKN